MTTTSIINAPTERTFVVEGCGADQTLTTTSAEAAAQEAAEWQQKKKRRVLRKLRSRLAGL